MGRIGSEKGLKRGLKQSRNQYWPISIYWHYTAKVICYHIGQSLSTYLLPIYWSYWLLVCINSHCASREITSQFLPQNDARMEAPLGCAMRPESPLMPGRSETPRPKPAAFIPRVHELAMPSRASTPLAAGCLLGSVRALLITGLPSAHSRIYHAWPGRTPA